MEENEHNSGMEQEEPEEKPRLYVRKLRKSTRNRIIFGICGGLGEYLSIDPVFFRLMFLFSILMGGWGIIVYLIAALAMEGPLEEEEQDDDETTEVNRQNNVSLIAGIILLAGLYVIFDNLGYFQFLSLMGISTDLIILLITAITAFFLFFRRRDEEDSKPLPAHFRRSRANALFGGVCSGLGEYLGLSPFAVRFWFISLSIITLGMPIIIYFYFIGKIPKEDEIEL